MSTCYSDIPAQDVLDIIRDDIMSNTKITPERKLNEISKIFDSKFCVYCGMVYYNCLCSHDD